MRVRILSIVLLSSALFTALLHAQPKAHDARVDDLRAFAKLYGTVRFFHPSDEASSIDWGRFAMLGATRVSALPPGGDLRPVLEGLFLPIAPSVQFLCDGDTAAATPEQSAATTDIVAWQHVGVGLGAPGPYRSVRLNRKSEAPGSVFGPLTGSIDAVAYRGKEIRLTAAVKAIVDSGRAQLWLRVDRAGGRVGFFDNMGHRPITTAAWAKYEITGHVDDDAEKVFFGGLLAGRGTAFFDDFKLEVRQSGGNWTAVPLENAGFESGTAGEPPANWRSGAPGYSFLTQRQEHSEGEQAVRITDIPVMFEGSLFDASPKLGEAVDVPLVRGLRARVPLALLSRNGQTVPVADAAQFEALKNALAAIDLRAATAAQRDVRIADAVIAWNVYQHFYPYFDVVKVDWDSVLTELLTRALADQTPEKWQDTLQWMVVQVQDGHGAAYNTALEAAREDIPMVAEWIEGNVVVMAVAAGSNLQVGDVVRSIDGIAAAELVKRRESLRSGTPQWRRFMAVRQIGDGPKGSVAHLVVDRGGKELELNVPRGPARDLKPKRPDNFAELRPGIIYVDLDTAEMKTIDEHVSDLAKARGIVFDLRGYPKSNHDVLRYLTSEPMQSAQWQVPQAIYPDRQRPVGNGTSGRWQLQPKEPRFKGKIVFLTDGRAISYAESVLGIVEHYRLGEIVGAQTAGTNGNVNWIDLPGGFRIAFTGMRVIKHDGSQHHLVGITPTVPASRTIAGIRAGRDEVVEKGIQVIEAAAAEKPGS